MIMNRFWNKVNKSGSCWSWTAGKDQDGYGNFWCEGKMERAHRMSYRMSVGIIPKGMWVLHKCDNPPCVRPDHLFLGTSQDNVDDMHAKRRHARGERIAQSKLTEKDVKIIRLLIKDGCAQKQIAEEYGVTPSIVSRIKLGRIWK